MAKLHFKSHVFDFALHPSDHIAAVGLITGDVECYRFGQYQSDRQWGIKPTKKSCRGVEFSEDGKLYLETAQSIRLMLKLEAYYTSTQQPMTELLSSPVNKIIRLNTSLIATGDDMGIIKIWDTRSHGLIHSYSEHTDFIADMTFSSDKNILIAVAGDGLLSVWDIRKPKLKAMSDCMDDELLSAVIVKNEKKVVVGSQAGVLNLWSWGDWSDSNDRILGHPSSIDTICKLDEDTICTGSSDGIIRLVTILPNKFEGVIGAHGEDFPIERLRLSYDNTWLASCAHDNSVRFWDVRFLFNETIEDDDQDEEQDEEQEEEHEEGQAEETQGSSDQTDSEAELGSVQASDQNYSSGSEEEDSYKFSDREDSDEAERAPRRKRRMIHKGNGNFFEDL
ncbi:hypothetical protein Unana1_08474 [Umbelopsis nana]